MRLLQQPGSALLLSLCLWLSCSNLVAAFHHFRPPATRPHQQPPLQARRGANIDDASRQGAIGQGLKVGAALLSAGLTFVGTNAGAQVPVLNAGTAASSSSSSGNAGAAKTIVITGANSGIGLDATRKLAAAGHQVYVACRTLAKAEETAKATGAAGFYECDLSSLGSVQNFVGAWGSRPIDVLCLNAGVAMNTAETTPHFTKEGFEETIGVNHFAHFLIAQKLLGNLEKSTLAHPRLVVTASSVHDPSTPGGNVGPGATLGDLKGFTEFLEQGKPFEMVDGGAYSADKAYKDSKALNVIFTEEMSRRLAARNSKVRCNCFSPGLIPSTGLFRSQNPLFVGLFNFFAVKVLGVGTTPSVGGDCLVYMALSDELEDKAAQFYATPPGKPKDAFTSQKISPEAADVGKAKRVWELSEKLLAKVIAA